MHRALCPFSRFLLLFIVVVIRYETTAAARWASPFIVRIFFNDAFTVAVWTSFLCHVDASVSLTGQPNEMNRASITSFLIPLAWQSHAASQLQKVPVGIAEIDAATAP
jgi:hypothetical protein